VAIQKPVLFTSSKRKKGFETACNICIVVNIKAERNALPL
jgi:hypothetical protein